ncbi:hypothetical protein JB92DRAFT_3096495 [Gautieria morchelliformis]|nr:hypothetical protein JB92DRAFT_3096495 [Gautieria morchelliformis]
MAHRGGSNIPDTDGAGWDSRLFHIGAMSAKGWEHLYAPSVVSAWQMAPMHLNNHWGWVIEKNHDILFGTEELLLNFPEFDGAYRARGLPAPAAIWGFRTGDEELVRKWDHSLPN